MAKTRKQKVSTAKTADGHRGESGNAVGELRFQVDSALLVQLGQQLVTRPSTALAELIKNAYDADATRVTVEFRNVAKVGGEITISDNGVGVPFERLQEAWMRIATQLKAREPISDRYGRPRAGAKGIGRFAAVRLAKELELKSTTLADSSKPRGQRVQTVVVFHWDKFVAGKEIGSVPIRYRRRRIPPARGTNGTGVVLKLSVARDAWVEDDFEALQSDLLKLVSPVAPSTPEYTAELRALRASARRDPGFSVVLKSDEYPEYSGELAYTFLEYALGVLEGRVDKDGKATYELKFRGKRKLGFSPLNACFASVGAATFTIHYFVYKKDFFGGLPISTRDAQARGRKDGGVHLYVDRFRVPPYGDSRDDWLLVDYDRGRRVTDVPESLSRFARDATRPMLSLPGNNQLFGQVQLSRLTNPGVTQTLSRERVVENKAFDQLRRFVRLGIDWMTVAYAREYATEPTKGRAPERDKAIRLLARAREAIEALAGDLPPEQYAEALQALDLAHETVEATREEFISELSMLRVLASTGTMIVVFEHQLMGTLMGLRQTHQALTKLTTRLSQQKQTRFVAQLERLDRWIDTARHQGDLLGLLVGRRSRSRRKRLIVRRLVKMLCDAFASHMTDYGIVFENEVPATLRTPPVFEAELTALLVNLLTNAFKAVREQPIRRVAVTGQVVDGGVVIRVRDTGVGLQRDDWEEYFKPFVGDAEPDPILGEGTGLGLKIVRDFVDVYGGRVRFTRVKRPWRTQIELFLPEE